MDSIHTDTWKILKDAFLEYFWSPTYMQDWNREAKQRTQGQTELVREYVTDKLRLIERCNAGLTEAARISELYDSLKEDIQDRLKAHDYSTVELLL